LEQIAENNNGKDFHSDYFIEYVVQQIRFKSPKNRWVKNKLIDWFEAPSGAPIWIKSFLRDGRELLGERQFRNVAVRWLRRYGKGTNSWLDLYEAVKDDIPADDSWNLRVAWLKTARNDLFSWPEVFETLADDAGSENFEELSEIARTWRFKGRSRRRNQTIEDFAQR